KSCGDTSAERWLRAVVVSPRDDRRRRYTLRRGGRGRVAHLGSVFADREYPFAVSERRLRRSASRPAARRAARTRVLLASARIVPHLCCPELRPGPGVR